MLFEKGSFLRQTGQRVEGRESKSWLVAGVRTEGAGVCDQTGATPREGVTEYFAVISQRRRLLLFTSVQWWVSGDTVVGASQQRLL